jgi:transposase-like protein
VRRSLIDAGLGEYSVQYDPANMVDWGGYRVPETFTACFEADRLGVQIEVAIEDDGPVCVAISRLHHNSPPLTSERRFPLRTMVNAAIRGAAFEIVDVPIEQVRSLQRDARLVLHKNTPLVPDERGNVRLYAPAFGDRESGEEGAREVSARRPRSDEDWRRLAAAYRRAVASGAAPSGVIAAEFGVSRPTARKWVQHARERGFLRPAVGRRAGEARAGSVLTRSRGS